MLRDVRRRHVRDWSYTGSKILSFLEQAEVDPNPRSPAGSFTMTRLPPSHHTSRSQSTAFGPVRPRVGPGLTMHCLC